MSNPVRWGFLSAATIARKNWRALRYVDSAHLVAVASRSQSSAEKFIAECQADVPQRHEVAAIEGYDALLARDDIDAVYVPLPTSIRAEWNIKAAEAGKHIVSEKPAAADMAAMRRIADAVRAAGVMYMDGTMFPHSKRLSEIAAVTGDCDGFGEVRRVVSNFSFAADDSFWGGNIRGSGSLEPLGCLGDLGWYCVYFTLNAYGWKLPKSVRGKSHVLPGHPAFAAGGSPPPVEFTAELEWENGASAGFYCAFLAENQQWAHVTGRKKSLRVDDFVLPYYGAETSFVVSQPVFRVACCHFQMERHDRTHQIVERSEGPWDGQEVNLFRTFSDCVQGRRVDTSWLDRTLAVQTIVSALYDSSRGGEAVEIR